MLAALPGISPKGLLEAIENPKVIERQAIGDLYVQLGKLRVLSGSPSFTIAQRLQYSAFLAKLAKVDRADESQDREQLPTINIIFEGAPDRSISARPVRVLDDSTELELLDVAS